MIASRIIRRCRGGKIPSRHEFHQPQPQLHSRLFTSSSPSPAVVPPSELFSTFSPIFSSRRLLFSSISPSDRDFLLSTFVRELIRLLTLDRPAEFEFLTNYSKPVIETMQFLLTDGQISLANEAALKEFSRLLLLSRRHQPLFRGLMRAEILSLNKKLWTAGIGSAVLRSQFSCSFMHLFLRCLADFTAFPRLDLLLVVLDEYSTLKVPIDRWTAELVITFFDQMKGDASQKISQNHKFDGLKSFVDEFVSKSAKYKPLLPAENSGALDFSDSMATFLMKHLGFMSNQMIFPKNQRDKKPSKEGIEQLIAESSKIYSLVLGLGINPSTAFVSTFLQTLLNSQSVPALFYGFRSLESRKFLSEEFVDSDFQLIKAVILTYSKLGWADRAEKLFQRTAGRLESALSSGSAGDEFGLMQFYQLFHLQISLWRNFGLGPQVADWKDSFEYWIWECKFSPEYVMTEEEFKEIAPGEEWRIQMIKRGRRQIMKLTERFIDQLNKFTSMAEYKSFGCQWISSGFFESYLLSLMWNQEWNKFHSALSQFHSNSFPFLAAINRDSFLMICETSLAYLGNLYRYEFTGKRLLLANYVNQLRNQNQNFDEFYWQNASKDQVLAALIKEDPTGYPTKSVLIDEINRILSLIYSKQYSLTASIIFRLIDLFSLKSDIPNLRIVLNYILEENKSKLSKQINPNSNSISDPSNSTPPTRVAESNLSEIKIHSFRQIVGRLLYFGYYNELSSLLVDYHRLFDPHQPALWVQVEILRGLINGKLGNHQLPQILAIVESNQSEVSIEKKFQFLCRISGILLAESPLREYFNEIIIEKSMELLVSLSANKQTDKSADNKNAAANSLSNSARSNHSHWMLLIERLKETRIKYGQTNTTSLDQTGASSPPPFMISSNSIPVVFAVSLMECWFERFPTVKISLPFMKYFRQFCLLAMKNGNLVNFNEFPSVDDENPSSAIARLIELDSHTQRKIQRRIGRKFPIKCTTKQLLEIYSENEEK